MDMTTEPTKHESQTRMTRGLELLDKGVKITERENVGIEFQGVNKWKELLHGSKLNREEKQP